MKHQRILWISLLWKQVVQWRLLLAVVSIALLSAQMLFWLFKISITPFDREAWLDKRNRSAYVTDLLWNRIKRGDTQTKVTALLGEPDGTYLEGGPGEAVYSLSKPNEEFTGFLYIRFSPDGVDEIRATNR